MVTLHFKRCVHCQRELSLEEFYRKGQVWHADCKACISMKRKSKYVSKKKSYEDQFNIKVTHFKCETAFNKQDIISCLEAFLIEELSHGQNINQ